MIATQTSSASLNKILNVDSHSSSSFDAGPSVSPRRTSQAVGVDIKGKARAVDQDPDVDTQTGDSGSITHSLERLDLQVPLEDGSKKEGKRVELVYRTFEDEDTDLRGIMNLCEQELSEPYNLYTYRYFLQDWPNLTFLVFDPNDLDNAIGTIVCKQESHRGKTNRGYIAMLSVDKRWRRKGIASSLVNRAIEAMKLNGGNEIVLETEYDNVSSLGLYEHLGFIREKRLHRFYTNGKDAFRLILPLPGAPDETEEEQEAGRDAISRAPELDALGGLPTISEEDRYFPLRVDTPRMKSGDVVVTPPMARPPPLPSRPDYEDLYT